MFPITTYHLDLAGVALVAGIMLVGISAVEEQRPATRAAHPMQRSGWNRAIAAHGFLAAAIIVWVSPDTRRCIPWLVAAAVLLLVQDRTERPHPYGCWTAIAALVGLIGVWLAVPDTEPPLVAAAVVAPLAGIQLFRSRAPGPAGSIALATSIAGVVWVGSAGWGSALAAVVAVAGVGLAPLVIGFGDALRGPYLGLGLALHCAVALVVPRAVMRWPVGAAWTAAVAATLALAAVLWILGRSVGYRAAGSADPTDRLAPRGRKN